MLSTAKVTVRCPAIAAPEETKSNPSTSDAVNLVINFLHHEFRRGARKSNAIAAATNIVATTSAGFSNLLADLVEHAAAHCWFDERRISQYPHPRQATAKAMK